MEYNATIFVTVISGPITGVSFFRNEELVERSGDIHKGLETGSYSIPLVDTNIMEVNADATIVGLSGFGFELKRTDGFKERGRYIEEYAFWVSNSVYDEKSGIVTYDYTMGITSPETVVNSHTRLWHRPIAVQFHADVLPGQAGATTLISDQNIAGTVCISDEFFKCLLKGLTQETSSTKKMQVSAKVD